MARKGLPGQAIQPPLTLAAGAVAFQSYRSLSLAVAGLGDSTAGQYRRRPITEPSGVLVLGVAAGTVDWE